MKKLSILLILVLVGVFFINASISPSTAEVQTLASVISFLNITFNKLTINEQAKLLERVTQKEIDDATILMRQWGALLKVSTEVGNIILER